MTGAWGLPSEDGARLLDRVHAALSRYVVLPSTECYDAVTLWVAATHAQTAWQAAPRLTVKSPEKRCGKTRLLDLAEAMCWRPFVTFNATVPAVVRSIDEADPATLLVDEADAIWSRQKSGDGGEDLRALLNAGFQRGRPVIRCVGPKQVPTAFPSFAMAALAGIGDTIPDTIIDRSVVVRMRRRAPGEQVDAFRHRRDAMPLHELRDELHRWLSEHLVELQMAEPSMPVEDRAADTWEPLVATADLAGGEWPARARTACLVMTTEAAEDDADASLSMRLLVDLRVIFEGHDRMHSAQIVERLREVEDGPWASYFGRAFTVADMTRRLKTYGLKAEKQLKVDGLNRSGFTRDQLHDVWRRYLPPDAAGTTSTASTTSTPQVNPVDQNTEVDLFGLPEPEGLPPDQHGRPSRAGRPTPAKTCRHGVEDGDQPDPFIDGRLRCTECRAERRAS